MKCSPYSTTAQHLAPRGNRKPNLELLSDGVRLVTHECEVVSPASVLLAEMIGSLPLAAGILWPEWYDDSIPLGGGTTIGEQEIADRISTKRLRMSRRHVNGGWLQEAVSACRDDRVPLVPRFPAAVQAEQLSLAIGECELLIAVIVRDDAPASANLLGLARVLEWFGREADARVIAILPESLADRSELDGISFGASNDSSSSPISDSRRPLGKAAEELSERKHLVCPILGRPHPASPGEQKLAARLASDAELQSLFRFNVRVTTVFESRYLVDLLWPEGCVVIEVDGYGYHSGRAAFNADRYRDYELVLSGYLVLRLPHDLVVEDVELAMERIRDFVNYCRSHPHVECEASK